MGLFNAFGRGARLVPLLVVPLVFASACADTDAPEVPSLRDDNQTGAPKIDAKKKTPPKPSTQTPAPGTSKPPTPAPSDQPPTLTSVEPAAVTVGTASKGVDIMLTGTKFPEAAQVSLAGEKLPATFVSPTQLKLHLAPEKLKVTGVLRLAVVAKAGESNSLTFTVANPTSTSITKLSPASVVLGDSSSLTIDITGTGFTPQTVVKFNGSVVDSTSTSATQLSATIPSYELSDAGRVGITVSLGDSVVSLPASFEIRNPAPETDSISPSTVTAGDGLASIMVSGYGFTKGSSVLVRGQAVSTTYLNSTSLRASIPSSMVATAGSLSIGVQNGAPGGGSSTSVTLSVKAPDVTKPKTDPDCAYLCKDYGYVLGECYADYYCIDVGPYAGCLGEAACGGAAAAPPASDNGVGNDDLPPPSSSKCDFECDEYDYEPGECRAGWYCWYSDGCLTQSVCSNDP